MHVYYKNERWKIIHQPVRDSLMSDLKTSGPNKIIIIDDLYTTGSTVNEIAKLLKENGAQQIWCLVLAKN